MNMNVSPAFLSGGTVTFIAPCATGVAARVRWWGEGEMVGRGCREVGDACILLANLMPLRARAWACMGKRTDAVSTCIWPACRTHRGFRYHRGFRATHWLREHRGSSGGPLEASLYGA